MKTEIGRTGALRIDFDEPWVAGEVLDTVDLVVHLPATEEGTFSPNLVARAYPTDLSIEELAGRLVSTVHEVLHDVHVLDVQMWQGPGTRAVVYLHRSPVSKVRIRAMDLIEVIDGVAVQVTVSTSAPQWLAFGRTLEEMARTVRLVNPAAAEATEDAGGSQFVTPDAAYLEQDGADVVDYSAVAERQPFPAVGAKVTEAAMDLLSRMADGYKVGRLGNSKDSAALRELEEGGLAERGGLSEQGQISALLMSEPPCAMQVSVTTQDGQSSLFAWFSRSTAFVVSGQGPLGPEAPIDAGTYNAALIPTFELSTHIAQWLGFAPAWQLELNPPTVDESLLNALVLHGESPVPDGGNPAWHDAATQRWSLWTLEARSVAGELEPMTYFSAGRRGQYRAADVADGYYGLVPMPTIMVADQIEDRVQALLFDRPLQTD